MLVSIMQDLIIYIKSRAWQLFILAFDARACTRGVLFLHTRCVYGLKWQILWNIKCVRVYAPLPLMVFRLGAKGNCEFREKLN